MYDVKELKKALEIIKKQDFTDRALMNDTTNIFIMGGLVITQIRVVGEIDFILTQIKKLEQDKETNNGEFNIFVVGYGGGRYAKYPYQRTENGVPLFQYTITSSVGNTDFTITDNIGEFTISIEEELVGKFCALLTLGKGRMSVRVWGGGTTEPYEMIAISSRNVTFDATKIIG